MSSRKKWATVYGRTFQRSGVWNRHPSQVAAYRWVTSKRQQHEAGMWSSPCIKIMVDEGNGWQVFEKFDLAADGARS